jgi:hypothetical protein
MIGEIKQIYGLGAIIFLLVIFIGAQHFVNAGEEKKNRDGAWTIGISNIMMWGNSRILRHGW